MSDTQSGETKSEKRSFLAPSRFQLLYFALLPVTLVTTFCLAAIPAQADIVDVILSNLTFIGPHGTETFSGSYSWDNTTSAMVPNTAQATAAGSLGVVGALAFFTSASMGPIASGIFQQDSTWLLGGEAEVIASLFSQTASLPTGDYPLTNTSTVGTSGASLLCLSSSCQGTLGGGVFASDGSVTVVPEPQTLALVASGILGLVVPLHKAKRWRRKISTL